MHSTKANLIMSLRLSRPRDPEGLFGEVKVQVCHGIIPAHPETRILKRHCKQV